MNSTQISQLNRTISSQNSKTSAQHRSELFDVPLSDYVLNSVYIPALSRVGDLVSSVLRKWNSATLSSDASVLVGTSGLAEMVAALWFRDSSD